MKPALDDLVKGAKVAGREGKRAFDFASENVHPFWHDYGVPLLFGSMAYIGASQVIDANVAPAIRSVLDVASPLTSAISEAVDLSGRIQSLYSDGAIRNAFVSAADSAVDYLSENALDLTLKASAIIAGAKVYSKFKPDYHPTLASGKTLLSKMKRFAQKTVATTGVLISVAAAHTAVKPDVDNLRRSFSETDVARDLDESIPNDDSATPDVEILKNDIKNTGKVSIPRMQADVNKLRSLGYSNITDQDLYYLARVVAGEAGNYYKFRDYALRQKEDMNAITNVVVNRYLASKDSTLMKNSYDDGGNVDLKGIVMKRKQFSIANSRRTRAVWSEGFSRGNLNHGSAHKSKTLLAYAVVVDTLTSIARRPTLDPTNGAVNYKNNDVGYAARKRWNGSRFGQYVMKRTKDIQDHTYYALFNSQGQNYGRALRRNGIR